MSSTLNKKIIIRSRWLIAAQVEFSHYLFVVPYKAKPTQFPVSNFLAHEPFTLCENKVLGSTPFGACKKIPNLNGNYSYFT